jgi:hypothetical protein
MMWGEVARHQFFEDDIPEKKEFSAEIKYLPIYSVFLIFNKYSFKASRTSFSL